jgi:hypothetical protein
MDGRKNNLGCLPILSNNIMRMRITKSREQGNRGFFFLLEAGMGG